MFIQKIQTTSNQMYLSAMRMNIAIVVSEFNEDITSKMFSVSKKKAESLNLVIKHECHVLGAYDMPLVVDSLLQKDDVDGVVTLGAIIKGQTNHSTKVCA